ncbi:MAG: AsmA-like C-terminal region-containing protein [Vicinamibacterales bacterium]
MVRRALIAFAVAVAAVVVVAALLLQSLGRGGLREGVESRLSAALGQPVSIGRLGMTLFPPGLTGSGVRIGDAEAEAPALDIARVRIVPRFRSLFGSDVVIERLVLDGFVVSVLRDRSGAWHVPAVVPAPAAAGAGPAIARVRIIDGRMRVFDRAADGALREAASIDAIDADVRVEEDGLRLAPITGRIGGAAIAGEAGSDARSVRLDFSAGAIDDDDLPAFLRLVGGERPEFLKLASPASVRVAIRVDRATSRLTGDGVLQAPRVHLEPLELERFEAPFTIEGSRLLFAPTAFGLSDGMHEGRVSVRLDAEPPRWSADSRVRGLDAGAFLDALSGGDQRLDGTALVTAALGGRLGESLTQSVAGRLRIEVDNGVIRGFPLLSSINRALGLAEQDGNDTRFERLTATFATSSGRGATEDLVLEAGNVRLEAEGWIAADRSLSLRGLAVLSRERTDRVVASIRELARLRRDGRLELPLTISGSLDAPSFGIDVQGAIRRGLTDELRRRLRGIIRR